MEDDPFYIDRMGRVPDRFDYLASACLARAYADTLTDPDDRALAIGKAAKYYHVWQAGTAKYYFWTESPELADYMRQRLTHIHATHPDTPYARDIQDAIRQLNAVK